MRQFFQAAFRFKTGACLAFTAAMLIYTVCSLLFGLRTMELVMVFQLLGLAAAASLLQLLCFSQRVFKKLRYGMRVVIFAIPMLGLAALCAIVFHWFPVEDLLSWVLFTAVFLVSVLGITLGFEIYSRITGRKYDGLLDQYRENRRKTDRQ